MFPTLVTASSMNRPRSEDPGLESARAIRSAATETSWRMLGPALLMGGPPQLFSRYPVLKIHHTTAKHTSRNTAVMPRLTPTLTSATSKKLQRKPEIK
jgi:hypothetical protein